MAGKKAAETPGMVKTAEVATMLEMTPQWVRDLTKRGVLKTYATPAGDRYNLIESVKAYIRYLRDQVKAKESKVSPWEDRKQQAEAELKEHKAKMAELQLKELQGKMHRSEDVEAATNDLVYTIRSLLMALPGRLAVDLASLRTAPEVSERMQAEVYEILNELAGYKYDPEAYKRRVRDRQGWQEEREDSGEE